MAAGARRRTAVQKGAKRDEKAKETRKETQAGWGAHSILSDTGKKSLSRRLLKAFFALVCIVCLILAVLPYLGGNTFDILTDSTNEASKASPPNQSATAAGSPKGVTEGENEGRATAKRQEDRSLQTNLAFNITRRGLPDVVVRGADEKRGQAVKEAFDESWAAYVEDAFGADEYHPIGRRGSNFSADGGVGYFIVDVIDMLLIMGDKTEYDRSRDWIKALSWDDKGGKFSVFETTIRTLGGLLSAHALCTPLYDSLTRRTSALCDPGDADMFLTKAVSLAGRLRPAFEANRFGLPEREVDLSTGDVFADTDNRGMISLAEAATIQLEFKYLAHATGDEDWWRLAERPIEVVRKASLRSRSDGLLPIFLNPQTGMPSVSEIRLGSRGDSYYEYLIKQFVQTNRSETVYLDMYQHAMAGIKIHLLKQSPKRKLLHTAEIQPRFDPRTQRPTLAILPKQDHLVCFLGGSAMLGALHVQQKAPLRSATSLAYPPTNVEHFSKLAHEDWTVGHELIRTCVDTYTGTKTGLSPEIAMFRMQGDRYSGPETDWYIKKPPPQRQPTGKQKPFKRPEPLIDARNILRPETVESLFIAFHLTGDQQYREWGWQIFQAFVKATRLTTTKNGRTGAFASIRDVDVPLDQVEHEDRMETFWLAETLKYLYLLFEDQDTIRLDQWVLNTEAHPLPIFTPAFETSVL